MDTERFVMTATPSKWTIFSLVATGSFMSTLDSSIVNVALPNLMGELGTNLATIEWVVLVYLIAFTSLILSFGRLSDIIGRRRILICGHLLFSGASLLCALSSGVGMLIFARALQGAGGAMIMSCSQALIVDAFPLQQRAKALGGIGTVVAAGLTSGPAIGGFVLTHFSWWMIFAINVPVGLVAAILASRILKGTPADTRRDEPFDLAGGLYIATGFGALFVALTHAFQWGYLSVPVVGLTIFSLLFFWLFARHELRATHPILAPALLVEPQFFLPVLSSVSLYTALFTMVFLMPFYLIFPMGYSEAQAGSVMMIPFALLFVVPPFSGALADRMGSRTLCVVGMATLAIALALLAWPKSTLTFSQIALRLGLLGFGVALFLPPNNTTIMGTVPPETRGVASSMVGAARNLGMVLGVAIAGAIFNHTFTKLSGCHGLSEYTPDVMPAFLIAFRSALGSGAVVALLGTWFAFKRKKESAA